jgi:hypothetical protein
MFGFAFWWIARLIHDADFARILGGVAVPRTDTEVVPS